VKRIVLLVTVTLGVFGATGGVAVAEVTNLNIGNAPPGFSQFEDNFAVLDERNNLVLDGDGPRAAFLVEYACTEGERIGAAFRGAQMASGDPNGGGGFTAECNGEDQTALVVIQKEDGRPNFTTEDDLGVEGAAATDLDEVINDVDSDEETLTPVEEGDFEQGSNSLSDAESEGDSRDRSFKGVLKDIRKALDDRGLAKELRDALKKLSD
jgi:hypothetical protein